MTNDALEILRVPILPLRMVSSYLVKGPRGAIAVDAGVNGSHTKILAAMTKAGMAPSDLRLIVLTHAHTDHAGGAAALHEASGAPVLGHASELPYYRGQGTMKMCATGFWGRLFLKTPVPHEKYTPVEPSVVIEGDGSLDLAPYGVDGRVVTTPGHTAGSLSVLLDGEAVVGDLVAGGIGIGGVILNGRATRPPVDEDQAMVGVSLQRMLDEGAERFHLAHGGPIDAAEVRRHIGDLERRVAAQPQLSAG